MRPSSLPAVRRCFAALSALLIFGATVHGAKPAWKTVVPAELAETQPKIQAAAEALLLDIQVDDRSYPFYRTTTRYVRYKVYDPEKAEGVTRLSGMQDERSGDTLEVYARLITPDGRTQEFGKEALRERALVKNAQQAGVLGWLAGSETESKEKFLAIPGVVRGSIVEFYTRYVDHSPHRAQMITSQMKDVPVRALEYRAMLYTGHEFFNRTFYSSVHGAKLTRDEKASTVSLTAKNLPAWEEEPFSGPMTEQVLTIFNCYEPVTAMLDPRSGKVPVPRKIKTDAGPWSFYATVTEWAAQDRSYPTKQLKQVAAEITKSAKDDAEKARLIHRWIRYEFQAFRMLHPSGEREVTKGVDEDRMREPRSVDDILDWRKDKFTLIGDRDFIWLAFGLYREAGLTAHMIMLPDRTLAGFNPQAVSRVFLPDVAVAIKLGDTWQFSAPHKLYPRPFNMLPWENEGQPGLLAIGNKQEFIKVPVSPAERSLIGTGGGLTLDENGTLTGTFVRHLTGQVAVAARGQLLDTVPEARNEEARALLNLDIEGAEIKVMKIAGLDDADEPLLFTCSLNWEGFAVKTKNRLIIRPLVFRVNGTTPFPAETRKQAVYFPRQWQELDQITITWPEGYELEGANRPQSANGETVHYRVDVNVSREKRQLYLRRTFASSVTAVPASGYPGIREFYDHVIRGDQVDAVLVKTKKTETQ